MLGINIAEAMNRQAYNQRPKISLEEKLLEEFDYVEDLGYVDDNIACIGDYGTVYINMSIQDKICTDGIIEANSSIEKEYGINHQYQTYELVVKGNPTYVIGVRKLDNDEGYYTSLFANYSKIDVDTYKNIIVMRDNLIKSFNN